MASFAIYREHTGVHFGFRMAAFTGGADVLGVRCMALSARNLPVAFIQRKIGGRMIKFLQGKGCHGKILAFMVRVTGAALQNIGHHAVHTAAL